MEISTLFITRLLKFMTSLLKILDLDLRRSVVNNRKAHSSAKKISVGSCGVVVCSFGKDGRWVLVRGEKVN